MENKWNLKLLYEGLDDPRYYEDIERSKKDIKSFVSKWKKNKTYKTDAVVLLEALDEFEKLLEYPGICNSPSYYIALQRALNESDTKLKAEENKLHDICLKLENDIQFFSINLTKISSKYQKIFLKDKGLKKYKHFLENTFIWSKYTLSDKEEKVFNLKSKTSHSNWVDMISELLSKQTMKVIDENGKKIEISYNEASKYIDSNNKKVRDYAAEQFYKINSKYAEIAEFEINSVLENKKINDSYRKVDRPDKQRNLSNEFDDKTVDTLREVVTESFDISREYYRLKAKALGQNTLKYYERNVETSEINKQYSFEEAFKIVDGTFGKLDKEFSDKLKSFYNNGQYDVYPKKSKSGGAFCISIGSKYPTYMLLNHNNDIKDVLTLAHESGHGIHSEFSNSQPPLNQGYPTSTAEVASTFFEDFVFEELTKSYSKEERKNILLKKLNDDISTILRQIACYNFEWELHKSFREEGYLSKERIGEIFKKSMSEYLGDTVEDDKYMELGWIYWSHIRRFFYVYSYASGLLISKYLQSIVREDPENIELVKEFFKSGNSKSPKEIFSKMGIDISDREFWIRGLDEIRRNLKTLSSSS
jgi:oligoendopeptidase F